MAFIASTGNTQGIKFRISPPSTASRTVSTNGTADAPGAAVTDHALSCPPVSRSTTTPANGVAHPGPGVSASVSRPSATVAR